MAALLGIITGGGVPLMGWLISYRDPLAIKNFEGTETISAQDTMIWKIYMGWVKTTANNFFGSERNYTRLYHLAECL